MKHGSLNVPIEHHPTIHMVYNGYYKVMSNIPKMGHLPTPVKANVRGVHPSITPFSLLLTTQTFEKFVSCPSLPVRFGRPLLMCWYTSCLSARTKFLKVCVCV